MRKSDTRCESKQECSSSKADELKVEFSAEWLRIWRYERGINLNFSKIVGRFQELKIFTSVLTTNQIPLYN